MKVLWLSNAPWAPSGYGSQTRQVGRRIARDHDIEFVANDRTRGDQEWEGHLVRGASGNDKYSRDSIREDLVRSGADWLIFLYDAWVFTEGDNDPFGGLPRVAGWVPIDHYPVPQSLYGWLSQGHLPIAMSRYGFDRLTELSEAFVANGKPGFAVRYAPHAVDDVFIPTPSGFRSEIGVPDKAFLVGIVAANNGTIVYDRKGFGDMAHAMALFMESHPDAYLYVHTIQRSFDGIDLARLFDFKGIPEDRLRWADQYEIKKQTISDERMAAIYSSFDVLLSTSRGEGFGLPVLEAQACGTPVIASNWTASAELVGEVWTQERGMTSIRCANGWLVSIDPDYDPRHGADFGKPRIPQIIAALNEAHAVHGEPAVWEQMRQAAIAKAEPYRADAVYDEHWRPILAEMELALRKPNRAERRAKRRAA